MSLCIICYYSGAFGEVFQAELRSDDGTSNQVAVKSIQGKCHDLTSDMSEGKGCILKKTGKRSLCLGIIMGHHLPLFAQSFFFSFYDSGICRYAIPLGHLQILWK